MSELQDYIKRNSKTISLKDGESVEVIYKGYKIGANKYDPEKETVYYTLGTKYGDKIFQSGALSLANIFDSIKKGAKIKLTRTGEGNKTKYSIKEYINNEWVSVGRPEESEEENDLSKEKIPF